ncbi:DUF6364 family protein [Zunongwangia sp. F260]|uniref:DUF6364 family protein n=1 Tax=Autumnicola lenta TaxID=3075593 RepID=A0ABU3CJG4_9FLAO|nr:DUF6364 family protein [Zunongwangia sp. F260]MDT0646090.1 DUF6364 family protein [Zunongwangia sp. F260]
MDTKLTLSLNKTVIERAKQYAKTQNVSLSKMIESYLAAVTEKEEKEKQNTPLVESLMGVIDLDADFDYKKGYSDYLLNKYK